MIDIQKLKQFPLGFKAFESYIEKQYGSVLFIYNGSGVVKNEDYVEFLDNNGLFVNVSPYQGIHEDLDITFKADILCIFMYQNYVEEFFDRQSGTESAILEAFKYLEIKLKTN